MRGRAYIVRVSCYQCGRMVTLVLRPGSGRRVALCRRCRRLRRGNDDAAHKPSIGT